MHKMTIEIEGASYEHMIEGMRQIKERVDNGALRDVGRFSFHDMHVKAQVDYPNGYMERRQREAAQKAAERRAAEVEVDDPLNEEPDPLA